MISTSVIGMVYRKIGILFILVLIVVFGIWFRMRNNRGETHNVSPKVDAEVAFWQYVRSILPEESYPPEGISPSSYERTISGTTVTYQWTVGDKIYYGLYDLRGENTDQLSYLRVWIRQNDELLTPLRSMQYIRENFRSDWTQQFPSVTCLPFQNPYSQDMKSECKSMRTDARSGDLIGATVRRITLPEKPNTEIEGDRDIIVVMSCVVVRSFTSVYALDTCL